MRTRTVALCLYIVSSFLAVLGTILHNEALMLLTKPAVIPAIFFYYLAIKKKQPVSIYILLVLLLNFIGDTIVLLEIENTEIIMIPFFFSNVILLKFAVMDVRKLKFDRYGTLLSVFIFIFLMYVMHALIQLFKDTNAELIIPVIIYGIVLGAFASIAVYCYYVKNATFTFYLLMTALLCIISDTFYIMFSLIFHFPSFNYFEFTVQMVSYFFIVKYFVLRKN